MAVAGAVATKARGVAANDSQATGRAAAGKRTTVASQAWHPPAAYKREYAIFFFIFFMCIFMLFVYTLYYNHQLHFCLLFTYCVIFIMSYLSCCCTYLLNGGKYIDIVL